MVKEEVVKEDSDILVSIIIPVYNSELYLKRCIDSIKSQTHTNFEAILINDGSTDNSLDICIDTAKNDNRFLVINKKNTGVSDTRNYGIKQASGKYITFVDSDDWIDNNYIKILLHNLVENNVDVSCCGFYRNSNNTNVKMFDFDDKILKNTEAMDTFSKYYFTSINGKLFKKELFKEFKFDVNIYYSEDTLMYTQILSICDTIHWTSKPLYYYFKNDNGAMKIKNPEKYFTDFIARKEICNIYNKYPELLKNARLRATESAILVQFNFLKKNFQNKIMQEELKKWIDAYGFSFLMSKNIPIKNKLIYLIIKHDTILRIYRFLGK